MANFHGAGLSTQARKGKRRPSRSLGFRVLSPGIAAPGKNQAEGCRLEPRRSYLGTRASGWPHGLCSESLGWDTHGPDAPIGNYPGRKKTPELGRTGAASGHIWTLKPPGHHGLYGTPPGGPKNDANSPGKRQAFQGPSRCFQARKSGCLRAPKLPNLAGTFTFSFLLQTSTSVNRTESSVNPTASASTPRAATPAGACPALRSSRRARCCVQT